MANLPLFLRILTKTTGGVVSQFRQYMRGTKVVSCLGANIKKNAAWKQRMQYSLHSSTVHEYEFEEELAAYAVTGSWYQDCQSNIN